LTTKKFLSGRNTKLANNSSMRAKSQLRGPTDSWIEKPDPLKELNTNHIGVTGKTSISHASLRDEQVSTAPTNYSSKKAKKIVPNSEIKHAY
jgi:hypothetical protein